VDAELAIHGGDLQHPWTLASGHDRRAWRHDCSTLIFRQLIAWLGVLARRPVPLPEVCIRALKTHRAKQAAELLAAGVHGCGLVFTSLAGTPIEPDSLRRSWYALRERAGLPTVRFHDLRHSCVTLLLDLGVPPHIVMRIVRHATLDVTMGIYAHAALEEQRQALRKLEDRLTG
jgi:integrase